MIKFLKITKRDFRMNLSTLSQQIGENIAYYRKSMGLTQLELAELVDMEKETISRIESGKHNVSIKSLERFMQVLAVQAIDLVKKDNAAISSNAERIMILLENISPSEQEKVLKILIDICGLCGKK